MNAFELHPYEGFEALTLVERAEPALGPIDVRVRVRAVSLNYRDILVARGAKQRAKPVVPISDGAGEVIEIGSGVTRVAVGDRVASAFFPTWSDGPLREEYHSTSLGGAVDGMLAEQVVLPASAWVKIPDRYSFEQAATLPCAAVTAWHALFEAGATVRPDHTVLIQGGGGVSTFALQLARHAGAMVIATSASAENRSRLETMGAEATIDYKTDVKWGETAYKSAGAGVDLVVEVGGIGTSDQSVLALRYGGHMSLLGLLTGMQGPISTRHIFLKNVHIHGVNVGSVAMFERLVRVLEHSSIDPVIDRVFPFDETRAAYDHLARGGHFGKVVIRVS